MTQCPNCSRENADSFNFCLDCGFDLKRHRGQQAASVVPMSTPLPTETFSASELSSLSQSVTSSTEATSASAASSIVASEAVVSVPPPSGAVVGSLESQGQLSQAKSSVVVGMAESSGRRCSACATAIPAGMRFCGNCGLQADDVTASPASPKGGRTLFMHAAEVSALQPQKVCRLIALDPSGKEGMTFTLRSGESVCGRQNGVILLFDDVHVSPTHATFDFDGMKLFVTDQRSLNGVYLRVQSEVTLHDGDFLRVGRQLLRYESLANTLPILSTQAGDETRVWGSPVDEAFGRLLQVMQDGRAGEIRLLCGESAVIGREQGDILFPTDGFVSGRHCEVVREGTTVRLRDLGSSNGTYIRLEAKTEIGHGDFLLVGNQMLRVEVI